MDLRYAVRTLLRSPGFAAAAILALGFGIGVNAAIFSVADAVFLRPLPFRDPDSLAAAWTRDEAAFKREQARRPDRAAGHGYAGVSGVAFLDWRDHGRAFSQIAAIDTTQVRSRLEVRGAVREVVGARVSAALFPLLGVDAALGRTFTDAEDRPGGSPVVLLSHALWQTQFGGTSDVLGKTVRIDGTSCTVVGVMPKGFAYPEETTLWRPIAVGSNDGDMYPLQRNFRVIARLRPGVSLEQARADLTTRAHALASSDSRAPKSESGVVVPLHEYHFGSMRRNAMVLLGAVGFVLLIACANVANLVLARSAARQRELAIRSALGAARWRILRQLTTESAVLAAAGAVAGIALAAWGLDSVKPLMPSGIPRADSIALDSRALLFTLGATVLTALIAGVVPALATIQTGTLNQSGRSTPARGWLRSGFVVAEVALAVVLLAGAGLLMNSFARLMNVDRGFESEDRLTARLPVDGSTTEDGLVRMVDQVIERSRRIGGVQSAAAVYPLPFSGGSSRIAFVPEGYEDPGDPRQIPEEQAAEYFRRVRQLPFANYRAVTPDYFQTLSVPLLGGRWLDHRDRAGSPPVVVVNETMARTMWPRQNPIGKTFKICSGPFPRPDYTVVGVVGDVRHQALESEAGPEMYGALAQRPYVGTIHLVLRTNGNATNVARDLRGAVAAVNGSQLVEDVRTLDDLISRTVAPRRLYVVLLAAFAALAMALAAVGLYGVVAYRVAERTREVGIRIAIGARPESVVRMLLFQALRLAAIGAAVGLAGALALSRVMTGLLYRISPTDPLTYCLVVTVLLAVAALAAWPPARRAAKVDPMFALRSE